jgi:hypothetical protein
LTNIIQPIENWILKGNFHYSNPSKKSSWAWMTQITSNHPLLGNFVILKWLHETKNKTKNWTTMIKSSQHWMNWIKFSHLPYLGWLHSNSYSKKWMAMIKSSRPLMVKSCQVTSFLSTLITTIWLPKINKEIK